jgi:hypothetical protein
MEENQTQLWWLDFLAAILSGRIPASASHELTGADRSVRPTL